MILCVFIYNGSLHCTCAKMIKLLILLILCKWSFLLLSWRKSFTHGNKTIIFCIVYQVYHFGIWILGETFKWALKGVFCSFANFYFISSDLENAFNSVCVLHNLYFSIMNVLYLTCITNHLSILHNMLIVEVKWLLFLYSFFYCNQSFSRSAISLQIPSSARR